MLNLMHITLLFDTDPGFAFLIQTRTRPGGDLTVGLRLADCFPVETPVEKGRPSQARMAH